MGAVDIMERGKLMLNLDILEEDMVDTAMMAMDVAIMERERPKLSLAISEGDMVVMDMDVATMERGKLMLRLDTLEEDMVDTAMVAIDVATMERERLKLSLAI